MARRLQAMGQPRYRNGFEVTLQPDVLQAPLAWQAPRLIFVNSMSDLFHENIPTEYVQRVFDVMSEASQHTFQVLTKRGTRLQELGDRLCWPPNVWLGVSVETPAYYNRIEQLVSIPAAVRFLSLEPLLRALPEVPLRDIDWVIVGGESGPGARPIKAEWVTEIRDKCLAAKVPFFFKQWGGVHKNKNGRTLEDTTWDQMPGILTRDG